MRDIRRYLQYAMFPSSHGAKSTVTLGAGGWLSQEIFGGDVGLGSLTLNLFQNKVCSFPVLLFRPGARFSKVPVSSGPVNLSGPLSGNFTGPDNAFLEAPVNFPGNFRAR